MYTGSMPGAKMEILASGARTAQTTMVYTHVLNRGGRGVRSPVDGLQRAVSSDGGIRPACRRPKNRRASFEGRPARMGKEA